MQDAVYAGSAALVFEGVLRALKDTTAQARQAQAAGLFWTGRLTAASMP